MVSSHEKNYELRWSVIISIASKTGCTLQSLRRWIKQTEIDQGPRDSLSSDERATIKEHQRENREPGDANESLRMALAYFAQSELNRLKKE